MSGGAGSSLVLPHEARGQGSILLKRCHLKIGTVVSAIAAWMPPVAGWHVLNSGVWCRAVGYVAAVTRCARNFGSGNPGPRERFESPEFSAPTWDLNRDRPSVQRTLAVDQIVARIWFRAIVPSYLKCAWRAV